MNPDAERPLGPSSKRLTEAQRQRIVELYLDDATWRVIERDEAAGRPSTATVRAVLQRAGVIGKRKRPARPPRPARSTSDADDAAPAGEPTPDEDTSSAESASATASSPPPRGGSGSTSSTASMPEHPDPMTELVPVPEPKPKKTEKKPEDEIYQCGACSGRWQLEDGEDQVTTCPHCGVPL